MRRLLSWFVIVVAVLALFELLLWLHGRVQGGLPVDFSGVSTLTVWATVLTVVFLVFAVIGLLNIDNRIKELNRLKDETAETHREMREQMSELKISANKERQKIVKAAQEQIKTLIEKSVDFQTLHDLMTQIASYLNPTDQIRHYTDLLHGDLKINNINRCLILARRGEAHELLQHYDEAQKDYQAAIDQAPLHPEGYIMMGNLLAKHKKEFKRSIEFFEKAIELDPTRTLVYGNIANAYSSLGDYDKAQDFYGKLRDYNIESPDFYYNKTIQDKATGRIDPKGEIEEGYLLKCLSINPHFTPALVNLSGLYGSRGRYDDALAVLNRTINTRFDPDFVKLLVHRAMTKRSQHFPALALVDFIWAYALNPNDIFVMTNIAECYAMQGSMSQAAQFATAAIKEGEKQNDRQYEQRNRLIVDSFNKFKHEYEKQFRTDESRQHES